MVFHAFFIPLQSYFIHNIILHMNTLSAEKQNKIQEQLSNEQKLVSFDMRELTIEFYVAKYLTNIKGTGNPNNNDSINRDCLVISQTNSR